MRKSILVEGDQNIVLSISLLDVLKQLGDTDTCSWKLLWLEATGRLIEGDILDLEQKVNSSENGYIISFSELMKLAESIDQIIELVLIGSSDINTLRRYESDEEMRSTCDYCIELVDSSYWEINSADNKFITLLTNNIPGFREL